MRKQTLLIACGVIIGLVFFGSCGKKETETPQSCVSNADCPSGYICENGECVKQSVQGCSSNADCASGQVCENGACVTPPDTTPPETTITSNPPNPSNSGSATFTFTSTEPGSTFECQIDGSGYSSCTSPKTYTGLTDGFHTFGVRAIDVIGNTDPTPAIYTWTIDTVPPTISINSPICGDNICNATEAPGGIVATAITVTTNAEDGQTVTLFANGNPIGTGTVTSGSATVTQTVALSEDANALVAGVSDLAGNSATSSTVNVTLDTVAPDTTITSNPPNPSNSSSATFTFTSTEPGSTFECQIDGSGYSSCTSPKTYTGLTDGSHTFEVRAKDTAGNVDTTLASYAWVIDTTPPTISINTPICVDNICNATEAPSGIVNIGVTTGGVEDGQVATLFSNGNPIGTGTVNGNSGNISAILVEGSNALVATVSDLAGNSGNSTTVNVTLDTVLPDTIITSNPPANTNSTSASFSFTSPESGTFECRIDAGSFASCTSPQNYSGLTEGSHTFYVRAIDTAGNVDSTPASYVWNIDLTPPDTTITSNPSDPSNSGSATFGFTCNEGSCTYECQIDGGGYSSCTSPKTYTGLTNGSHTFEVRAIDLAGNSDPTPATYIWLISIICPEQVIFFDNMESGTGNWIPDTPWGLISPGYSGSYAWTDSPAGNYSVNIDKSLKSIAINIPSDLCWQSGQSEVVLSFMHKYFIGAGDTIYVDVSSDGVNWTTKWSINGSASQSQWTGVSLFTGFSPSSTFYIRFRLFSDSTGVDDGWYIDDVRVYTPQTIATLWSYITGPWMESSSSLGDIDNDGKLEVVVGSSDKKVYALNGEDGSVLWSYTTGEGVGSSPSLGDIDNDGKLEVVVGSYDYKIYALNGEDGSLLWSYTTGYPVRSSPSLGDIDNDGKLEVVVGSWDKKIYALNGENGSLLWSYTTGNEIHSSPSLGDIDNDGKLEVVVGSADYKVYALNGEDGSLLWSYTTGYGVLSSPSLGDIDNDGKLEVVVGSADYKVYALNGENGSLLWSYTTGYPVYSSPAFGDIDNDGKLEVVVGSEDYKIYALNGENGSLLWSYTTGYPVYSSPAFGDIDNDGKLEVVVGSSDKKVYALNGEDGSLLWSYTTGDWVRSSPSLGDIDNDGKLEVVVGSQDNKIYALKTGAPVPSLSLLPWPKFRHDIKNTGFFTGNPNPPW
jgi:Cys-rich repeat protein